MSQGDRNGKKSWLVLVAVAYTSCFTIGCIESFGVLLPYITEQLAIQTWVIGFCVASMSACGYTIGLLTDVLANTFGPRAVAISCGFVMVLDNVMLGSVPLYFDKYYKIAVSIYCCTSAVGILAMPLLTQIFYDSCGWRGALILICGIGLHSIPLGALLHSGTDHQQTNLDENNPLIISNCSQLGGLNPDEKKKQEFWKILVLRHNIPLFTRVLVPGLVYGYVLHGWMIYIVTFAIANGASGQEASIVASCGGIGVLIIRILRPFVDHILTYKQIMISSSVLGAASLVLTTIFTRIVEMSLASIFFGIAIGALGTEIYILTKYVADEDQYYNVLSLFHLSVGYSSVISGIFTGLIYQLTSSSVVSFLVLAAVTLLTPLSLGLEELLTTKST
ncbi:monocarboxylate transporter 6-like [Amphiura filiformis]|uniref:monocarboxylate transporter 6-like n=1 Tax=Amphiura filiformis TaxID=82378 RepID=UPI003B211801